MNGTRLLRLLSSLAALSLVGATALACDQSEAKADPTETPSAPAESAVQAAQPSDAAEEQAAGQQAYDEESFALELHGPDGAKVGEPVKLSVVLAAQNGFKVNKEYPAKFKFAANAAVKPAKEVVRREDAKVTKTHCEMPLGVTLTKPGKHRVGGTMSFSVCTDDRCLIEKRDLVLEIDAS